MNFLEFLYFGLMGFFGFAALSILMIVFIVSTFFFVFGLFLLRLIRALTKDEMVDIEKKPIEVVEKDERQEEIDRYTRLMLFAGAGMIFTVILWSPLFVVFAGIFVAIIILIDEKANDLKKSVKNKE